MATGNATRPPGGKVVKTGGLVLTDKEAADVRATLQLPSPGLTLTASDITDSTAAGQALLTAADATAQRVLTTTQLSTLSGYGTGTVYSLTNTAAAVALGTTSPTVTLNLIGRWLITAAVQLTYTGATVVAETATLKLRRTNNTAADLTSSSLVIDLPVATTLTNTYGIVLLPSVVYTTAATTDIVTIFANVSAGLGAGTIDAAANGTFILATYLGT